ncbi:MAG: DUF1648 domain-containing protein [Acidobacteriota bacterium]|nr:DUF1648 domain-containing protein [Acidobacteriota bacterium]
MADIILLTIIFLLELLLFYFLPTLDGQQTLFGIVLKDDNFQTYGLPILRKYRRDLSIIAVASACGLLLIGRHSPNSLTIAYIIGTLGIIYPLFKYLGETWKLRDKSTVSRLATPLKPRHLRDFSSFWAELAVLVLTIVPLAILTFYYPSLPDVVPIHWNAAGEADGWAKKNFSSVFFLPVLAAFLQFFWIILKQDIIKARFRVPAEQAEKILSLKEISLQANVGMVDWCRLVCGVLLGTVALLVLSAIAPSSVAAALNISVWTILIVMLSGMAFYLYRMILVNREIKALTGQITFQTADEMEGWTNGLFYYNPQDAAFMVEKPGGVGYTINFAHKRAFFYLALVVLPIIFSIFSLILMKFQ